MILRSLISLAASAPAGRFGGQDALSPPVPSRRPWLHPGSGLGRGWRDHEVPRAVVLLLGKKSPWPELARSAAYFVRIRSRGDGGDERWGSDAAAWPKAQLRV